MTYVGIVSHSRRTQYEEAFLFGGGAGKITGKDLGQKTLFLNLFVSYALVAQCTCWESVRPKFVGSLSLKRDSSVEPSVLKKD